MVPGHGSIVEGPHHEMPSRGKVRIIGEIRRPEVVLFDDPTSEDSQVLVFKVKWCIDDYVDLYTMCQSNRYKCRNIEEKSA